ncbi:hypothetical protein [Sphingopyxis lindanitolerans]|uniref:hypothetical protein n=1 Tax=Sphingopyxis lindanitolerans TaxID=2054227 RepID=UPI0013049257|nr:hypothetical protein [Sphingopyxis lindanitolerans]
MGHIIGEEQWNAEPSVLNPDPLEPQRCFDAIGAEEQSGPYCPPGHQPHSRRAMGTGGASFPIRLGKLAEFFGERHARKQCIDIDRRAVQPRLSRLGS